MNSITLTGNLTRDAELRKLSDGTPIASFSVADNAAGKDKPAIFWNCSLFGKRAESLLPYLLRGQQVTVVGSITERDWTDKEGHARKSMDVRVNDVALQGGKRESGERQQEAPRPAARPAQPAHAGQDDDGGDDIPFITASAYYDMTTSKARRMARHAA